MTKFHTGLLAALLLLFTIPALSNAQTSVQKRFSEWVFIRAPYLTGEFSCQAIQCTNGNCDLQKYFVLNAYSGSDIVTPVFNQGFMIPPDAIVTLVIGAQKFQLANTRGEPSKFFQPRSYNQAKKINALLSKRASASGQKYFHIIGRNGHKHRFSARGLDQAYAEINKKCGAAIP